MTEVNGLRLAYRGLIAGLAGGYAWAAIAMTLAGLLHGDPLRPLEPIATAIFPVAGSPELSFVLGLGAVQAGGALLGMCFAYFFGRFFTVRPTLAAAGLAFALLSWGLVGLALSGAPAAVGFATQPIGIIAAIGFGIFLGAWVPLRGEVVRQSGSPVT
jgi:hypothetical protein